MPWHSRGRGFDSLRLHLPFRAVGTPSTQPRAEPSDQRVAVPERAAVAESVAGADAPAAAALGGLLTARPTHRADEPGPTRHHEVRYGVAGHVRVPEAQSERVDAGFAAAHADA